MLVSRCFQIVAAALTLTLLICCGDSSTRQHLGGTVVDPYIIDARFQEVLADGTAGQLSSYSDSDGRFSFPHPLKQDSTVVMVVNGLHNGLPFSGTLKTDLQLAGESLVISPLTTLMTNLLATGLSVAETETTLQRMLETSGVSLSVDDLNDDPVATALQSGQTELLEANLATNAFLNALDRAGEDGYYLSESAGYLRHLENRGGVLVNLIAAIRSCLRPEHLQNYQSNDLPGDLPAKWRPSARQLIQAASAYTDYLKEQLVAELADGSLDIDLQTLIDELVIADLLHNLHLAQFVDDPDFVTYMEDSGYTFDDILSGDTFRVDHNGNVCPTRNSPPVADAGPDQDASHGIFSFNAVTLDGNGSSDPDNDPLSYAWRFVSLPPGSQLDDHGLSAPESSLVSFTPDVEGDYVLQLVVDDGRRESIPDTVTISAPPCSGHGMCGF